MNRRDKLKKDLLYLGLFGGNHLRTFRLMYSSDDLSRPIGEVVDKMAPSKLNWALKQVQNSIDRLNKT